MLEKIKGNFIVLEDFSHKIGNCEKESFKKGEKMKLIVNGTIAKTLLKRNLIEKEEN